MTKLRAGLVLASLLGCAASVCGQGGPAWEKSYALNGQPVLALEVSDSSLMVHSCGDCKSVHVRVEMEGAKLSDYRLEESQAGNTIHFSFKEKPQIGIHIRVKRSVKVLVETPANATPEGRSADGSLSVNGLRGAINLASSDGSLDLEDVSGDLHLRTNDGSLRVRGGSGKLEARSSDGSEDIAGSFESWQVSSSDGALKVELLQGTKLSEASSIETRDGSLALRVPRELAAEFEVETRDGSISSDLPLLMSGYNSKGGDRRAIRGTLNGGGPLLAVRSSDGSVRLE